MRWDSIANPPQGGFFVAGRLFILSGKERLRRAVQNYFWIMIGSALGGGARYWCSGLIAERVGETFPWGTLFINILGSLVIGFFATLTGPDGRYLVGTTARQFVMVGLCGGYTTFSAFSLQSLNLAREGEWFRAGGYVGLSVVLCLVAVWLGHAAAAAFNQMKGA
jgi:CrcB protein